MAHTAAEYASTVDIIQQNSVTLMSEESFLESAEQLNLADRQADQYLLSALSELQAMDFRTNEPEIIDLTIDEPTKPAPRRSGASPVKRPKRFPPGLVKIKKLRTTRPLLYAAINGTH